MAKKKLDFSFITRNNTSIGGFGQQAENNSQATGRLSDPDPVYYNQPTQFDYTSKLRSSHAPTITLPPIAKQPSFGSAYIRGTVGSLPGRAVTPLVERLTGRKVDINTIPQSNTLGQKAVEGVSQLGAELPLWMGGEKLIAKPLSMLARSKPIVKGINMLPKFVKPALPALGTGVKLATTYGGPINAIETAVDGDGTEGFVNRLKQAPIMGLGGVALHGGGQLIGKGIKTGLSKTRFGMPSIPSVGPVEAPASVPSALGEQSPRIAVPRAAAGIGERLHPTAEKVISKLDDYEVGLKNYIASRKGSISSTPVDLPAAYVALGTVKLAKGTVEYSVWSADMVKDFGEDIRPSLRRIYIKSTQNHNEIKAGRPIEEVIPMERFTVKPDQRVAGSEIPTQPIKTKSIGAKNIVNDPNPIPNAETGKPFKATLFRGEVSARKDPARGTFYTQDKEYADIYAKTADVGGKPGSVVTNEVIANNPLVSLSKRNLLEEWSKQGDETATKLLRAKDIDFGNAVVERYIAKKARELGHDSIVLKNMMEVVQLDVPKAMAAKIENPVIARTSAESPVNMGALPDTKLKERKFAENVRSSQIATPEIKANLDENKLLYEPITNKETFNKASAEVEKDIVKAREMFDSPSKGVSADDVALGEALISKHIREGNTVEANKLIAELAEKLTTAGQAVQAASIFKRLSPEGMLMYARKVVNGINKDAIAKQGSKAKKVELTAEDTKFISDKMKSAQKLPDGREKDVLVAEAAKKIAEKKPVTLGQKISTIQTMAQLLNPKTAIRNIVGNAGFGFGTENASQIVGTGVDKVLGAFTGKRTVTLPSLKTQLKSGKAGLKLGIEDALKGVNTSGLNTQLDLATTRTFTKGPLSKLETALNLELRAPDRAFYTAAYDDSLRSQLKAYNIKSPTKILEPTNEMKDIADLDGLYKTFQDKNALSDLFSTFKQKLNAGKDFGVGDFIIKYAKTPSTIIMRGIDMSPAGFIKATYEAARPLMKQEFNQRAFVQAFSRAATGTTGLVGMGALLHKSGIITGARNTDPDVAALQDAQGIGQFKINASALKRFVLAGFDPDASKLQKGDTLVSYDWFAPQAIPLAMGADIDENGGKATGLVGTILNGLASGTNTLADQPVVQGLQTLFGSGGASAAVVKLLEGVPASFVPTLLNQIKQLTDNQKRDTYSPNFTEKTTNLAKSKIPILQKSLQPKYDVLGKPLETYKDKGNNAFNVFLNPAFVTKYTPSEQAALAIDTYNKTGETKQIPTVMPKNFTIGGQKFILTPKEYSDIQKTVGEETNKGFGSISSTLDTDRQIEEMTKVIEKARLKGKADLLDSRRIRYTKSGSSIKLNK